MRTHLTLLLPLLAGLCPAQDFSPTAPRALADLHPRTTVKLRWSVSNWDTKTIASGLHGIYLSTDTRITTDDRLIKMVTTPSMGKLQYIHETPWDVPVDLPRGTYYLGMICDPLKRVSESNEGNNVSVARQVFLYGRPDLSLPVDAQLNTSFARGGQYPFSVTVRNDGGHVAEATQVELRLSLDAGISVADPVVATLPVPALLPGNSVKLNGTFKVPVDWRLGTFYLGYWLDRLGAVRLDNYRSNNVRAYRVSCFMKGAFWTFGAGCRGTNGIPKQYARCSEPDPYPGTTVTYSMTLGSRSSLAMLGVGLSRTDWNGLPLPRSMAFLGAPGCILYTSLDLLVPLPTSPMGAAELSFRLPSTVPPGTKYYTQFFAKDTVNALGFVGSDAIGTTVGSVR